MQGFEMNAELERIEILKDKLNWVDIESKISKSNQALEAALRDAWKSLGDAKPEDLTLILNNCLDKVSKEHALDSDVSAIISLMTEDATLLTAVVDREEKISKFALRLMDKFKDIEWVNLSPEGKVILVLKLVLFSSPTEMLFSFLSTLASESDVYAEELVSQMLEICLSQYPVRYNSDLTLKQRFEVSVPFMRSLIFFEQTQVLIVFGESLREYLQEKNSQLWDEIASILAICVEKQGANMSSINTCSEANSYAVDSSLTNLFGGHEDILEDNSLDQLATFKIMFRRYQDRTAERISLSYLSLVKDLLRDLVGITDPGAVSAMLRYLQDYLVIELSTINANTFIFEGISELSPREIVAVIIDKIREQVKLSSKSEFEVRIFNSLIGDRIISASLAEDLDLLELVENDMKFYAEEQVILTKELISYSSVPKSGNNLLIASLGFYSPFRMLSALNLISWKEIGKDVNFDRERKDLKSNPLFESSLMLSWIIFKEQIYNNHLVNTCI